jgi:hypothetical protein
MREQLDLALQYFDFARGARDLEGRRSVGLAPGTGYKRAACPRRVRYRRAIDGAPASLSLIASLSSTYAFDEVADVIAC